MKSKLTWLVFLSGVMMSVPLSAAAEVLGHISDETEPAATETETPQANDRRIVYRVICTPEGESLPDCERPFNDTESVDKSTVERENDASPGDAATEAVSDQPQDANATTGKKKAAKKSKKSSSKKTAKKSAAKKTAAKKK